MFIFIYFQRTLSNSIRDAEPPACSNGNKRAMYNHNKHVIKKKCQPVYFNICIIMENDMEDFEDNYVESVNTCKLLLSYCRDLESNPCKKHVHMIARLANEVPTELLELMSKYWVVPIVTFLQNDSLSTNVKEELVKAMRIIIQKITLANFMYFLEIYMSLLKLIFDKRQPSKVITFHEELKETVALCIKDLIHHSYTTVKIELYVNKRLVGQGILFCLRIAKTEKSSAVRLAAIEAIMALCHIDDETDKSDIFVQEMVAKHLLEYLPGTVSGLQDIAMGTDVQNHKITMMAVQAWGRYIALIFHDNKEEEDVSIETLMKKDALTDTSYTTIFNPKCDTKNSLKGAKRNREWLEPAAIKLGECIEPFLDKIRSHFHYKVRRELVESIGLILKDCPRNMRPNIMALIDHIIALSEDESVKVSEKARNVLHIVDENYMQNHNMKSLMDLLEDRFCNFLKRLSADVIRSDDNEQLAALNQFAGYLRLLGRQRLPDFMKTHIQKLLLVLASIMTIDCSNVPLLQTTNVKDLDDPAHFYGSDLWRQFKFIESNSCKKKLVAICKLLRELGDYGTLVDNILELMSSASKYRKELSLLLNWILASVKDSSILDSYKQIVDFYITSKVWNLPIEVNENTPLGEARSNIVQCCLLTEGLGHIAQNLQNNDYIYVFFRQTLYLIIERAGSGNGLISYIGLRTLETIAEVQHETISDLLRTNVDYFSYDVVMKLRKVNSNPGVLDVIEVVTKYSKLDFLPHLRGIVEDVLKQISTPYYQNDYSFLKIFYTFVVCIKTLMERKNCKATRAKEEATRVLVPNTCSETIILSLMEYYNAKKIDEKIDDDFEETESNIDVPNTELSEKTINDYPLDDEEDKKLPTHITIIVKIMKRCLHYLPLKDVQKSLMAMQTLQEGLLLLVEWENELLPIVHELWHPLIDRFKDENVLVINRAWQLLYVLATVSNDFIRSRTLRQVLPPVFKFLNESSKKSVNKSSIDMYKFTQTYKLQHELLSTFGLIAQLLKLREKDVWQILSNTQMYLSAHQHPILQTCCVKLYKDIADYNGDIVWTKCLGIWNSKVARITADATFRMESVLNSDATFSNEYRKNVQEIIKYIEGKNAMLN